MIYRQVLSPHSVFYAWLMHGLFFLSSFSIQVPKILELYSFLFVRCHITSQSFYVNVVMIYHATQTVFIRESAIQGWNQKISLT